MNKQPKKKTREEVMMQNLINTRPGRKPNESHGGHTIYRSLMRGETLDRRTRQGKLYHQVRERYLEEAGGMENVCQGALNILDASILPKLLLLAEINNFAMSQESVFDKEGGLLPCLGQNYLAYSNGLRRDIETFYDMIGRQKYPGLDLMEYLKSLKEAAQ